MIAYSINIECLRDGPRREYWATVFILENESVSWLGSTGTTSKINEAWADGKRLVRKHYTGMNED